MWCFPIPLIKIMMDDQWITFKWNSRLIQKIMAVSPKFLLLTVEKVGTQIVKLHLCKRFVTLKELKPGHRVAVIGNNFLHRDKKELELFLTERSIGLALVREKCL